jgi:putative transposase
VFHPTPAPTDEDVARIVAAVFRRVERALADREPDTAQRRFIESAPVLAAAADASAWGVVATGPRRGRRIIRIGGAPADVDAFVMGKLCAQVDGFNLQAAMRIGANDREGLERMARYLARPPIATDRLSQFDDGRLELRLKRSWRDGTAAFVFTPHEIIEGRRDRASPEGTSDSLLWSAGACLRGEVRDRARRGFHRRPGSSHATSGRGRQARKAGPSSMGVSDMASVPE